MYTEPLAEERVQAFRAQLLPFRLIGQWMERNIGAAESKLA